MIRYLIALTFFCLVGCGASETFTAPELEENIARLRAVYAKDRRTDRVEVAYESGHLTGYTTLPNVADSLLRITDQFPSIANRVRLLPDTAIGENTAGIINVSVANLRSEPGHSQELATQALLGTPIEVLDLVNNWYLVRTPDRYLAWLEPGAFVSMRPEEARKWMLSDLQRFVAPAGFLTASPGGKSIISDLVTGNLLTISGRTEKGYSEAILPDGKTGWLSSGDLLPAKKWQQPEGLSVDVLLQKAQSLAGRPYLWGGTSPKGMDCSGFTKTAYYLNGYVIPRDASQQVHAGTEIELTDDFASLLAGDLLFFGRYREDGSEKITHVGVYLGDGRFLHAGADNGRIRENSLVAGEEDYAEHRLKSLLRARRLVPGTDGVLTIADAFGALVE